MIGTGSEARTGGVARWRGDDAGTTLLEGRLVSFSIDAEGVVSAITGGWRLAPCGRVVRGTVSPGRYTMAPLMVLTVPFAAIRLEDERGRSLALVRWLHTDRGTADAAMVLDVPALEWIGRALASGRVRGVGISLGREGSP